LFVSQMLTLYTTPVIYLYLDRLRLSAYRRWRIRHPSLLPGHLPEPGE
jgi:multidrug efflux pump